MKKQVKYVFITGGVVSSLGKGITSASLALLLKSVLMAENRVGLMMNVHKDKLDAVLAKLPALQRPTVAHLSDPDWFSLTTIIDKNVARDLIPDLMLAGAEGLVEYSLNKVIL